MKFVISFDGANIKTVAQLYDFSIVFFLNKIIFLLVSLIIGTQVDYIIQYEKQTLLVKYPNQNSPAQKTS